MLDALLLAVGDKALVANRRKVRDQLYLKKSRSVDRLDILLC